MSRRPAAYASDRADRKMETKWKVLIAIGAVLAIWVILELLGFMADVVIGGFLRSYPMALATVALAVGYLLGRDSNR
ncbi:hypothetical protein ACIRON_02145 [Nocardioides sp. NPDC101246]|uniref:hypothetical protein n=1 Tax=Nocardioides sp. NPDC101246 TaxID=3364336 RepID=UPI003827CC22